MTHIHSYPSVYAIGHAAIKEIFSGPVVVQEKIDGSQFSFGKTPDGELVCRSKGKQMILDAPEKMFTKAIATVRELEPILVPGWTYRGEFLQTPKHNTLAYARVPEKHIILFDINSGQEQYLHPAEVFQEAVRLGLEHAPYFHHGAVSSFEMFQSFLERESVLGGCKIEGVVVKNYDLFTPDKKAMMGKYVSEAFKEKHTADWKERNPIGRDIVLQLGETYKTDARWRKAIQHLRDDGKLEGSPRDIGMLIREVPADILREHENEIRDALFKFFWPKIQREVIRGFPEFYKAELAQSAFEKQEE